MSLSFHNPCAHRFALICRPDRLRVRRAIAAAYLLFLTLGCGQAYAVPDLRFGKGSSWEFSMRDDVSRSLSKRSLMVLAGGALLTAGALAVEDADAQAQTFEHYETVADIGNAYGSWPVVLGGALLLTGAGRVTDRGSLTAAGVDLGRAYVYSSGVVVAMKVAFDRTRPDGNRYSFPSGHAAGAFSTAPVIAQHFGPWAGATAYALAGATMIGRMEERKHYLSDVVFGAALGFVIGDAVAGGRRDLLLLDADRVGLRLGF